MIHTIVKNTKINIRNALDQEIDRSPVIKGGVQLRDQGARRGVFLEVYQGIDMKLNPRDVPCRGLVQNDRNNRLLEIIHIQGLVLAVDQGYQGIEVARNQEKDHAPPAAETRGSLNKINLDDTGTKVEKAIKAAAAVGLTMTKIPTYEYKEVEIKEDMPTIQDRNLLAEINSDSFVQRSFISSKSKKQSQSIVIDLDAQTVTVPDTSAKAPKDDTIINFDEIPSEEDLKEMWIKKLYHFRKKMLRGDV